MVGLVQGDAQGVDPVDLAGFGVDQGHLQLGPHPRQRRAQVVGDGVAGVADGRHGRLQPIQHGVQPLAQLIQFVAGVAHGRTDLEVAVLHRLHDPVQPGHGVFDPPADVETARQAQQHDQGHGTPQGLGQARQIGLDVADVLTDEQMFAAGQGGDHPDGATPLDLALGVRVGQAEGLPVAGAGRQAEVDVDRGFGDVAGDRLSGLVGQQIQIRPAPDGAFDQGLVQGIDAARAVDRCQGAQLDLHIRLGPTLGLRSRGEINIGQDRPRRRHKQRQEQQRQPERRAAKEGGKAHGVRGDL